MTKSEHARAVIVGSGVAGSLVATELLRRGITPVVILEAGSHVPMRERRPWLDFVMRRVLPYDQLYDGPEDYEASGPVPWQITGGRLIGRGGATLHWGGWSPRYQPEDFCPRTAADVGIDWPVGYDALEPYYCHAETYLQVAGDSNTTPYRSKPYPLDHAPFPAPMLRVMEALRDSNYSYQPMPIARNTISINGMPACQTIGTCDYCPIGGRFTGDQPLDRLARAPGFELRLDAVVRELVMERRSRVAAVKYIDRSSGEERQIEAEWFFICSGALEAPKLLLSSRSAYWVNGIGNDRDLVGRFLTASPFLYANGTLQANPELLQAELSFPTLCSRHWDSPAHLPSGKMLMTVNYNLPSTDLAKLMNARATRTELDAATRGPMQYQLWGALQAFSHFENRVEPAAGTTRFGLPRTRITTPVVDTSSDVTSSHRTSLEGILQRMGAQGISSGGYPQRGDHAMGTTRMSSTEEDGVTNDRLRVHGVDNLYVASNSVFPSGGAANPTLTLVALILRALDAFPN